MHRLILGVVLVAACDASQVASQSPSAVPPAPPTPIAKPVSPQHRAVSTFRMLDKDARVAAAAAIAARFPAAWAPKVEVDFAGFPRNVTLTLPDLVAEADRVPRALALLREHATTFGILDARDLPYHLDTDMIRVGAGKRWTGQIVFRIDARVMTIYGHLWPIVSESITRTPAELEALVKPFYGLHGEFRSKCSKDCGVHDSSFDLDKRSFAFKSGIALVCTPEGVVVRTAVAIERRYRAGSRVPGIEKLPELVDARTLAPIVGTWFMPASGTTAGLEVVLDGHLGFDSYGPCFGS